MVKTATQYFLQALFEHFCYHDDYPGEASNDPHDVLFDDDGLMAFEKYLENYSIYTDGLYESLQTYGTHDIHELREVLAGAHEIDNKNGQDSDWAK